MNAITFAQQDLGWVKTYVCLSADSCKATGTFGSLFLRVLFIAQTYFKLTILLPCPTKC